MTSNAIYLTDIGTVISLNTGVALAGSTVSVSVRRPDNTLVSWPGTIDADGQSVDHTIIAGDLTVAGNYTLQAQVVIGADTWSGDSTTLIVKPAFS